MPPSVLSILKNREPKWRRLTTYILHIAEASLENRLALVGIKETSGIHVWGRQ